MIAEENPNNSTSLLREDCIGVMRHLFIDIYKRLLTISCWRFSSFAELGRGDRIPTKHIDSGHVGVMNIAGGKFPYCAWIIPL